MEQYEKYVNTHVIIDEDYEKYDDIDFIEWENNDIKLKCWNIETKPSKDEIIILKEKEYMEQMDILNWLFSYRPKILLNLSILYSLVSFVFIPILLITFSIFFILVSSDEECDILLL